MKRQRTVVVTEWAHCERQVAFYFTSFHRNTTTELAKMRPDNMV